MTEARLLVAACLLALVPAPAFGAEAAAAPAAARKPSKIDRKAKKSAPERPVNITSDSFVIDHAAKRARWSGHVRVDSEDVSLTCNELSADYDESRKPKRLTCQGQVHVVQKAIPPAPDREVWGQTAVFENGPRVVTLTGTKAEKPRAREGTSSMQAERFIFYVDENRLQADKPAMEMDTKGASLISPSSPPRSEAQRNDGGGVGGGVEGVTAR